MRRKFLKLLVALLVTFVLIVATLSVIVFRAPAKLVAEKTLSEGSVKPQLAGRSDRAALIAPDGSLWAWGGTYTKLRGLAEQEVVSETPVRLGSDKDWSQIALGTGHTVALKTNGTLWGWGTIDITSSPQHELSTNIPKPILLDVRTNWVQIAAGNHHSLALSADGTLSAWGRNSSGQLGDGTTTGRFELKPVNEDKDWKAIAAGAGNSYAIKRNGTLWIWGSDASGTKGDALSPVQMDDGTDWISVSAASFVFCTLKADGTIWLGGHNAKFMGSRYGAVSGALTQIGNDKDWIEMRVGDGYLFARKRDGTWWIFGDNSWGELGIGALYGIIKRQVLDAPERLPFEMEPWAFNVSSSLPCTTVLLRDGTLWSWGTRLGVPDPSQRFREWKLRFNRTAFWLSGQKFNGFTMQSQPINATPRKIWELPEEVTRATP